MKRAPRSLQRHVLYRKYNGQDSEISALLGKCGLKAICQKGWNLANWLTHAKNATRSDAELCLSATEHLIQELITLAVKSFARSPEQCGRCGSFKIKVTWRPEEEEYLALCEMCGAEGRLVTPQVASAD